MRHASGKFVNLKLGNLGNESILARDVASCIEWIMSLSANSYPTSIAMHSKENL